MDYIKDYFVSRINELNEDYSYSPLSNNDILELIYNYNIVPRIDTQNENYRKYTEIEFFSSNDISGNTKSTFDSINNTQTITGTESLKYYFTDIITDVSTLNNRQQYLLYITKHRKKLQELILQFSKIENSVYWYLKDKSQEFKDVISTLYFQNKWLNIINSNPKLLNIYYFFLIIWTPLWGLLGPIVFFLMPYFISKYVLKVPIPFNFYWNQLKGVLFGSQFFKIIEIVKQGFTMLNSATAKEQSMSSKIRNKIIDVVFKIIVSPVGKWIYFGILVLGYFWSITNSIITAWNMNKFTNFIHDRITTLYTLINICNTLNTIIPLETANIPIEELNIIKDNDILELENNICSNTTFGKIGNIFTLKGNSLSLYWKLFNESKYNYYIILKLKYLGYIDKMISISSLLSSEYKFNLCEYLSDSNIPVLKCYNMFHPVFKESCIKNDICLYKHMPETFNNVILEEESIDNIVSENDNNQGNENNNIDDLENDNNNIDDLENDNNNIDDLENENTDKYENIEKQEDKTINNVNNKSENTEPKNINEDKIEKQVLEINNNNTKNTEYLEYNQNCILTGPNGSGKSSLLKTILTNIIFSQTIGLTASDSMLITPFKYISSYLNIADAQGKESLFQAEMSRCHSHLQKLKELECLFNGFSFNIMDEIFVSTNYYEGVSGAYGVIKSLDKMHNSINIITTHFDALTQEENRCSSYCFKHFTMLDNGNKDYKLRTGINKKHMALSLLKDKGFDADICNNARCFYKKIKNLN